MLDLRQVTDTFAVAPQIAVEDIVALRDAGFTTVVSNRPDGEESGQPTADDFAAAVEAAGLVFRHIPVAGGFSLQDAEAMADVLAGSSGPVFAFCRSGTRSTLLWSLAQASRGGDPDAISAAAANAGYDIGPVRTAVEQLSATS